MAAKKWTAQSLQEPQTRQDEIDAEAYIRERIREIQATWSEREMQRRVVGESHRDPLTIDEISFFGTRNSRPRGGLHTT